MQVDSPAAIFLASLLIVGLGWLMRRVKLVTRDDGGTLVRVVLNVTLPALILVTVPGIEFATEYLLLPLVAIVHSIFAFAMVRVFFRGRSAAETGLIAICLAGFNNSLFAVPITRGIWGLDGVRILAIFDIGNGLVLFGVSYVLASWYGARAAREREALAAGTPVVHEPFRLRAALAHSLRTIATSVPMIAFAVALVLNITGWQLPGPLARASETIAAANGALALFVLGIFQEFHLRRGDLRFIAPVLLARYALGAVGAVVAVRLLGSTVLLRELLSFATLLPIGMTTIAYSYEHGLDSRLATTTVNLTNFISFGVMWILAAT